MGAGVQVRKQLASAADGGFLGKRNSSRTCLVQTFGRAGTNLGRDGLWAGVRRWFLGHGRGSRVPRPGREGTLNTQPSILIPEPGTLNPEP